jgi:hypothetical protein
MASYDDNGRARPVIRAPLPLGDDGLWFKLIPAGIISGVMHIVLVAFFVLFSWTSTWTIFAEETGEGDEQVIETRFEDQPEDLNLENDELGIDPSVPTNYDVARIEEVSVPGPVDPTQDVGIANAPEGPPQTIAPPPGFNSGAGGGVDGLEGSASMFGAPGGYGGQSLLPGMFAGRSGATREQMVVQGGGNSKSEAAVAAGLKWIVLHQFPDGHWAMNNFHEVNKCNCTGFGRADPIASTGFGLLPLLGAGETHKPNGATRNHMYHKNVERGIKYLLLKQNREGDFQGASTMYSHGIATTALCEAFALTADPALKGPCQRALDFTMSAQHEEGGWRYQPKQQGDTSHVGWQVQALKSGMIGGLTVSKDTLRGANRYLDAVSQNDGATYGYMSRGAGPATTAIGHLVRMYTADWGPRTPALINGVAFLEKHPPHPYNNNMYYYYYATQVMHHFGGEQWKRWNEGANGNPGMRDTLIDRQDRGLDPQHSHQKGSWSPSGDAHGGAGGRLYVTSLSILTLEVYYRHLPLYRRELGNNKDNAANRAVRDGL